MPSSSSQRTRPARSPARWASVALPAAAQSYGHGPSRGGGYQQDYRGWHSINQRQANLDRRIEMGVRYGSISRREAVNLRAEFNQIARLEAMFSSLLDYSKPLSLEIAPFRIERVVEESLCQLAPHCGDGMVETEDLDGSLPPVLGDAAKIGLGTWLGILFGVVLKLGLAFTMLGLFALAWWL